MRLISALAILFGFANIADAAAPKPEEKPEYAIICIVSAVCDGISLEKSEEFLKKQSATLKNYRLKNNQTLIQFTVAGIEQKTPADERKKAYAMIERLVALGADVNAVGEGGLTALHAAVLFQDEGSVDFLLKKGAKPSVKAGAGKVAGQDVFEFASSLQKKRATPERAAILERLRQLK